jgi:hypothetical protein
MARPFDTNVPWTGPRLTDASALALTQTFRL